MNTRIILFTLFLSSLLFANCGDGPDVLPPYNFFCRFSFVDQEGNSLLKENRDKLDKLEIEILEPKHFVNYSIVYNEYSDQLVIDVGDDCVNKMAIDKSFDIDYVFEVKLPEELSSKSTDVIRVNYHFSDEIRPDYATMKKACLNDIEAISISSNEAHFKIVR